MDRGMKQALWSQFGAALDMLEGAIRHCPDDLWSDRSRRPEYWYLVYHTVFWLDLYLSDSVEGFAPPPPFTLDELDPRGVLPERVYARQELLDYLEHGRRKARVLIAGFTDASARSAQSFHSVQGTRVEILLYNLRHIQHHTAQLYATLRQAIDSTPGWVGKARLALHEEVS